MRYMVLIFASASDDVLSGKCPRNVVSKRNARDCMQMIHQVSVYAKKSKQRQQMSRKDVQKQRFPKMTKFNGQLDEVTDSWFHELPSDALHMKRLTERMNANDRKP